MNQMNQTKLPSYIFGALLGLILASLIISLNLNPTADITWRLHVAGEILAGKEIYRDVIETNPPLWFWASLGWRSIANQFNLDAYLIMCVGIHGLSIVALLTLNRLARDTLNVWERGGLLFGFIVGYLFVSVGEIGQREQALFVGATLWIALACARIERRKVPIILVVVVTLFAAYGFALKHYFVAIPVITELFLLGALRRNYRPIRLETCILGLAAICYALAVVYFVPLFLTRIVPLVSIAYSGFGSMMSAPFHVRLLFAFFQTAFVILPVIALIFAKSRPKMVLGMIMLMGVTAILVWLQLKGWRYHKLASQAAAITALTMLLSAALGRGGQRNYREIRVAIACLVVATYIFIVAPFTSILRTNGQPVVPAIRELVFSEPQNSRIAMLSVAPEHAFYIFDRAKRPQWSRHYGMWMLPGLQAVNTGAATEPKRLEELARVRREFIADLQCVPPDVVISEQGEVIVGLVLPIDTLGFLKQDILFTKWFDSAYRQTDQFGIYRVWRLIGARPQNGACPRDP